MPVFADAALLPEGWARNVRITISDRGTIESVIPDSVAARGDTLVDSALPGMPNVHSHAFQLAMAGFAERRTDARDDFWGWRETMFALTERLDPDALYTIALAAYRAMLAAGYTSVAEFHYLHRDPEGHWYADRGAMAKALIGAAREAGIAIELLPALYAHGDVGGAPLDERRKRFATGVDDVLTLAQTLRAEFASDPDVAIGVCAHSLRAVTPHELDALVSGSPRNVPVHIHVSEQRREVEAVERFLGARPVAWLLANMEVDERWCLVHATHLVDAERREVARRGAVVGLCPTTEANLGDGIFPLAAFLADGGTFGIGSDSNVSIDVVEELRWLEYGQRLVTGRRQIAMLEPTGSCGDALYSAAARGGGRALGRLTGALSAGYRADLIVLEAERDVSYLLDRYIFAAIPLRPYKIMVSGRWKI